MKRPSAEQRLYFYNYLVSKLFKKKESFQSILVVKLDEFGDMATTTHVFQLLKQEYPKAILTLLCKKAVESLIVNDPYIDKIITDVDSWNSSYDLLVELRGSKETLLKALKYRPKYRCDRGSIRFKNMGGQSHEVDTNFAVIAPLLSHVNAISPKLYPSESNEKTASEALKELGPGKYVVVHAGARKALRRWSTSKFAALIDVLTEKGYRTVLTGGEEDIVINNEIQKLAKSPVGRLDGKLNLLDFAAFVKNADLFIGNESGPLHIASCMEIPIIGLYGPGVKDVFYPYHSNSRVIHHILDCNPCNQIDCVNPENTCMNRIDLQEVILAVEELIIK